MEHAQIVPPSEKPQPGDLFFERGTSLAAAAIRLSQLASHNHVGVVIREADNGQHVVAEADDRGFRIKVRQLPGGYVVRMPGGHASQIVAAAMQLAATRPKYDWAAIVWHGGRFFSKWTITRAIGESLKRLVRPRVTSKNRLICSEAALWCLREVGAWPHLTGRFDHLVGFEVSPTDLFRSLVGHRDD